MMRAPQWARSHPRSLPPSRPRRGETTVREMDAYHAGESNSLILSKNSQFFEILSQLIRVGNSSKSRCGTGVSWPTHLSQSSKNVKFPAKFPVSREFLWRRVRSALRRQPATRSTRESGLILGEGTVFYRVFVRLSRVSGFQKMATLTRTYRKSPAQTAEIPIFAETVGGDRFDHH